MEHINFVNSLLFNKIDFVKGTNMFINVSGTVCS